MAAESGNQRRAATARPQLPPVERDPLACPRCESAHTKFCYYNNYNFSQPRHFCKSCRRYWTHGGTLRDIPVGGSSRKSAKRCRTSSTSIGTTLEPIPSSAPPALLSGAAPGIFALGGYGLGLEEVGFGLGGGLWAFPHGVGYVTGEGGGDVSRGATWHMGIGPIGDCFPSSAEVVISTPCDGLNSQVMK